MSEFDLVGAQRRIFTSTLRPLERLVALAICDFYSRKSPKPYPSVDELAYRTGLARRAVMRAIGGLEAAGALQVSRGRGLSNRYDLGGLMTLPARAKNQCPIDTSASEEPVPMEHPTSASGDTTTSASGDTLRNPLKEPMKEPISSAPLALEVLAPPIVGSGKAKPGKPSKAKAAKPEAPSGAHAQVVACYFDAFKAQHGREPSFDGADGTAVKKLLVKLKGDTAEACRRVKNAFTTFRAASVTIRAIASNPDAFASPETPKGVGVQRGPGDSELIARMRAQGAVST